ncbi:MAG: oxidoreductase [Rhodothermaceae bacterium]|nr:MAG: oxidoreductase [Rhodothermaceae bacterium]
MKHRGKRPPEASTSRRDFLKKSALAATAVVAGCSPRVAEEVVREKPQAPPPPSVLGANERINVGFIGVGGQGFYAHLQSVINRNDDGEKRHDYVYNAAGVAAADLFSKRRDRAFAALEAARAAEGRTAPVQVYEDYRELLDRQDIDAVFIGTVDHWHAQIAIDAMESGKHVYCEKPMTRYLEEAFRVYEAVKRTGRTFQIGSQYCTEGKWHRAAEMIRAGRIGPLVLAQDSYTRNTPEGEWNYYQIEPELQPGVTIDWKKWLGPVPDRPFNAEHYHRWRKYYDYCCGILGDLLAHRIHPLLIATGNPEFPKRVACLGTRRVTLEMLGPDDRDVTDNTQVLVEFPSGYSMLVIGSTVNEQGLGQVIRGHEATLYFSGNTLELRPERPYADLIDPEREDNIEPGPSVPAHILNFFESIRNGTPPNGNIDVAIRAQTIISLAEMSERLGEMLYFDETTRKITNGSGKEFTPITHGTFDV